MKSPNHWHKHGILTNAFRNAKHWNSHIKCNIVVVVYDYMTGGIHKNKRLRAPEEQKWTRNIYTLFPPKIHAYALSSTNAKKHHLLSYGKTVNILRVNFISRRVDSSCSNFIINLKASWLTAKRVLRTQKVWNTAQKALDIKL